MLLKFSILKLEKLFHNHGGTILVQNVLIKKKKYLN